MNRSYRKRASPQIDMYIGFLLLNCWIKLPRRPFNRKCNPPSSLALSDKIVRSEASLSTGRRARTSHSPEGIAQQRGD
jgi:hypothetical protein